ALTELPETRAIVEVGSYCGRATIVLASVLKIVRPTARVWSIDPHDGKQGTADRYVNFPPSLAKLKANITAPGLTDVVEFVQAASAEVPWQEPIALLLIDGLHDYASVARDFNHFEPWLVQGGFVAFHDYASYFPGVMVFVDQLLGSGEYCKVHVVGTLIVA